MAIRRSIALVLVVSAVVLIGAAAALVTVSSDKTLLVFPHHPDP